MYICKIAIDKYEIYNMGKNFISCHAASSFSNTLIATHLSMNFAFSPIAFLSFCINFLSFLACLFIYLCYISWLPLLSLSDLQIQLQI